ncbi:hypothetical protein [Pleionea sp. CnH1-48]|uniref:hypothetical protein n=1 Tax=Pleionea sp. CnH1-48 TaxID=2954494 RepID=UPI002097239D|nr:hypothetical protein [Pleionea sp. CnH1-48]MCO7226933.1 hypothetical protein [Pleionea sp. CnH1-48]
MRPTLRVLLSCILLGSFLSGCSHLDIASQKTVKHIDTEKTEKGDLELVSFPAELRGAYVYTIKGKADGKDGRPYSGKVICAEPFADVAVSSSLDTTAKAIQNFTSELGSGQAIEGDDTASKTAKLTREKTAEAGLNVINTIVALEGRTQFVLLAREMLYRTCEAAANGFMDKDKVVAQHELVVKALTDMIDSQNRQAEVKAVEAKAETVKAFISSGKEVDEKVLKDIFENNNFMQQLYLESYETCVSDAKDNTDKIKQCRDETIKNMQLLK